MADEQTPEPLSVALVIDHLTFDRLGPLIGHLTVGLLEFTQQITLTTPLRRMILQFSQIRLTLLRTFMTHLWCNRLFQCPESSELSTGWSDLGQPSACKLSGLWSNRMGLTRRLRGHLEEFGCNASSSCLKYGPQFPDHFSGPI